MIERNIFRVLEDLAEAGPTIVAVFQIFSG